MRLDNFIGISLCVDLASLSLLAVFGKILFPFCIFILIFLIIGMDIIFTTILVLIRYLQKLRFMQNFLKIICLFPYFCSAVHVQHCVWFRSLRRLWVITTAVIPSSFTLILLTFISLMLVCSFRLRYIHLHVCCWMPLYHVLVGEHYLIFCFLCTFVSWFPTQCPFALVMFIYVYCWWVSQSVLVHFLFFYVQLLPYFFTAAIILFEYFNIVILGLFSCPEMILTEILLATVIFLLFSKQVV